MAREKLVRGGWVAAVALVAWLVGSVVVVGPGGAYADDSVDTLLQPATLHKLETALSHGSSRSESDQLAKASAAVGPLFRDGLGNGHSCTASVVTSASGNVLLTAAHCLSGSAVGWQFAPGWDDGRAPAGVWTVTGAYVEPGWSSDQDQDNDVAVLTVADKHEGGRTVTVQDVAGSNPVGTAPAPKTTIVDVAYNADSDVPLACSATVYQSHGYPAFDCDGYVGGSSGSPWLSADAQGVLTVRGVIGGLEQGGCSPSTSFSIRFDAQVDALVHRADTGGATDTVPSAGASGC